VIDAAMEESSVSFKQLAATSKQFARRLLIIGENRLELLAVEVQEERERLLHTILLALGVATFGLLMGITATALIVVLFWAYSPALALLTLTALYGAVGLCLYRQLTARLRDAQTLAATLEQLRKDRACLENVLE
jgi:uncharacterized membrane protein YqjE